MITCYIGLGSNLGQPIKQIHQAIDGLKNLQDSELILCSPLYSSQPMGPQDQPDYVNAVACIRTTMSAHNLLEALQEIEQTQGRERKSLRWGPRTLDLDILLYGDETIHTPTLTVPHYGLKQREFVLYPLLHIAPDLILPDGSLLANCIQSCDRNGLQQL